MPEAPRDPFELSLEMLRARRGSKWLMYGPECLAAWVADMDFTVAEPVHQAIARFVEHKDYGYAPLPTDTSLADSFVERMRTYFDWSPDPAGVQPVAELIQALFSITYAFSEPGDGILLQTPIYPPFLMTIAETKRRMVENRLRDDGTRYVMDLDNLRRIVDDRPRIVFFCNPHNPTGRVFERPELEALAQVAVERDLVVVSDEIHADLTYPGHRHIPLATLGPEIATRTITITSATKGFNIPGLRCALMHFGSPELRQRYHARIHERLLGRVNAIGIAATVAAWREGQPWLETVMARLQANRERVTRFLAEELPGVHYYPPEGTYLAWLDCRDLDLPDRPFTFFLEQARVGLNDGAEFGPGFERCVRLNFATSASILEQVLERMATAVRSVAAVR